MAEYTADMQPEGLQGKIDYLLEHGELRMQSTSVAEGADPIVDWWNVVFTFGWFQPTHYTHTYLSADNTDLSNAFHDIIRDFIEQYGHKLEWGWWENE